jgi:hypothetical protein
MILNNNEFKRYKRIIDTQNVLRFVRTFLILGVLVLSVIIVYNFDLNVDNPSFMKNKFFYNYSQGPNCENLSFQKTAICLNDFVRDIFIYNITDDDIDLSLEELKMRGGDCRDWTNFYEQYMNYYGYNQTQIVRVFVGEEEDYYFYHVFLIASHSSGYCHMDMKDLECFQYSNNNGEVRE